MKKTERDLFLLSLSLLLACLSGCSGNVTENGPELQQFVIKSKSGKEITYYIELADDNESRAQGLMHRRELPLDQGMLLDFGKPGTTSIWMKNTYIPLDLLFIDADGVIVKIVSDTKPLQTRQIYRHPNARAVLEINAHQALKQGISVGDRVEFDGLRD